MAAAVPGITATDELCHDSVSGVSPCSKVPPASVQHHDCKDTVGVVRESLSSSQKNAHSLDQHEKPKDKAAEDSAAEAKGELTQKPDDEKHTAAAAAAAGWITRTIPAHKHRLDEQTNSRKLKSEEDEKRRWTKKEEDKKQRENRKTIVEAKRQDQKVKKEEVSQQLRSLERKRRKSQGQPSTVLRLAAFALALGVIGSGIALDEEHGMAVSDEVAPLALQAADEIDCGGSVACKQVLHLYNGLQRKYNIHQQAVQGLPKGVKQQIRQALEATTVAYRMCSASDRSCEDQPQPPLHPALNGLGEDDSVLEDSGDLPAWVVDIEARKQDLTCPDPSRNATTICSQMIYSNMSSTKGMCTSVQRCTDKLPPSGWNKNTCELQKAAGNCEKSWFRDHTEGYCHRTCGKCTSGTLETADEPGHGNDGLYYVHPTNAINATCAWQCYLDNNAGLQTAFGATNLAAAKQHFIAHGYAEGRDCTCPDGCNWNCYLSRHAALQNAFGTDTDAAQSHYTNSGQAAGRDCTCPTETVAVDDELAPLSDTERAALFSDGDIAQTPRITVEGQQVLGCSVGFWTKKTQKIFGSDGRAHRLLKPEEIGGEGQPAQCDNTEGSAHFWASDPNCVLPQDDNYVVTDVTGGTFDESTAHATGFVATCTCEKWSECFAKNLTATLAYDGRDKPTGNWQRMIEYVAQPDYMVCRNHKEVKCEIAHGTPSATQNTLLEPKKKDMGLSC